MAVASLAAAACLFNVGCERHSASEQYYLIAANIGLSYWKTANEGLQAAALQYGVRAEMRGPNRLDRRMRWRNSTRWSRGNPPGCSSRRPSS